MYRPKNKNKRLNQHHSGCYGKLRHPHEESAANTAKNMSSTQAHEYGWYKCTYCNFWHVGRTPNQKKNLKKYRALRREHRRAIKNAENELGDRPFWLLWCADTNEVEPGRHYSISAAERHARALSEVNQETLYYVLRPESLFKVITYED